ncbi:hypothetical protein L1987_53538 [Smallanthus sonchifolius]|uniref:Uncharacterized protein n=1 Tax=Smallanthus sonchifolius TaxID=185202 RepID=A0ACB9EVI5_9ASTR|nr:hypothetical protein L1987_53538 [Smallanthus sonchifolius]
MEVACEVEDEAERPQNWKWTLGSNWNFKRAGELLLDITNTAVRQWRLGNSDDMKTNWSGKHGRVRAASTMVQVSGVEV